MAHIIVSELGLFSANPLSEPMLACSLDFYEQISVKFTSKYSSFQRQRNALDNVVCNMATILSRPQCVKREYRFKNLGIRFIYASIFKITLSTDSEESYHQGPLL